MTMQLEDLFPLHCELASAEFARAKDAKDLRSKRYHLEQAMSNFRVMEEVLVQTVNKVVSAEIAERINKGA
jgi:hypothetical protein